MKDRLQVYLRHGYRGPSFWKQPEGETYSFAECTTVRFVAIPLLVTVNDTHVSIFRRGSHRVLRADILETRNPSPNSPIGNWLFAVWRRGHGAKGPPGR
jgi:hypothetical protein